MTHQGKKASAEFHEEYEMIRLFLDMVGEDDDEFYHCDWLDVRTAESVYTRDWTPERVEELAAEFQGNVSYWRETCPELRITDEVEDSVMDRTPGDVSYRFAVELADEFQTALDNDEEPDASLDPWIQRFPRLFLKEA